MSVKFVDSTALVTGSNRGIGRAITEALLARRAKKVYATARDVSSLQDLKQRHGDRVELVALDVTDAQQVRSVAADAHDVDLLINNAGYAVVTDLFGAAAIEGARREFEVNYFGTLNTTRAFAKILADHGGGAIVNVVSVGGLVAFPLFPTYADSKAAVHSLTTSTRLSLASQKTFVAGVYPGPVDTDMARSIPFDKSTPQHVAEQILEGIASGREDIFPDPMALGFVAPYEAGAKTLERMIGAMMQG